MIHRNLEEPHPAIAKLLAKDSERRITGAIRKEMAAEHGMLNEGMELTIRTCFAFYISTRMSLDLDNDIDPIRMRLVLLISAVVKAAEELSTRKTDLAVANMLVDGHALRHARLGERE